MAKAHWLDPNDQKLSFVEIEHEFESMSGNIAQMSANVERLTNLLENKVAEIQDEVREWRRDVDQWRKATDDQLRDIHHCRTDHQKLLDGFEAHIKTDKPVEHYLGKWALGIVMFVATIAGSFVVNRILHLLNAASQ